MAKSKRGKGNKNNKEQQYEKPAVVEEKKPQPKPKERAVANPPAKEVKETVPKQDRAAEETCTMDTCKTGKCPLRGCCCPLCPFSNECPFARFLLSMIWLILLTVGFVFFLIVRDNPSVTFDLCRKDFGECITAIVDAVKPYAHPYKMIAYLRLKGYVHSSVC